MLAAININIHLFTVDKKFNIVSQQIELNLTKKWKILNLLYKGVNIIFVVIILTSFSKI